MKVLEAEDELKRPRIEKRVASSGAISTAKALSLQDWLEVDMTGPC